MARLPCSRTERDVASASRRGPTTSYQTIRICAIHWCSRVGFTKFATRMLGEAVEMNFEVKPGAMVETGQALGWIEGFKAVTDLYAPFSGRFEGGNPDLAGEIKLVQTDPSGRGWLYSLRGTPGEGCLDVQGYVSVLDATIDKMLGEGTEDQ